MMIVMGRKEAKRDLGWVAEFCPVCRVPQAMRAKQVERVLHVYLISTGPGEPLRVESTCPECGVFVTLPIGHYSSFSAEPAPAEQLTEPTNPGLHEALDALLDWESRAVSDEPGSDERLNLIEATVRPLAYWAYQSASSGASESISAVLTLLFIIDAFAVTLLWHSGMPLYRPLAGVGAVLLVIVVWRAINSTKQAAGKAVLPKLARAMAVLNPTEAELDEILNHRLASETRKSIRLDTRRLLHAINAHTEAEREC